MQPNALIKDPKVITEADIDDLVKNITKPLSSEPTVKLIISSIPFVVKTVVNIEKETHIPKIIEIMEKVIDKIDISPMNKNIRSNRVEELKSLLKKFVPPIVEYFPNFKELFDQKILTHSCDELINNQANVKTINEAFLIESLINCMKLVPQKELATKEQKGKIISYVTKTLTTYSQDEINQEKKKWSESVINLFPEIAEATYDMVIKNLKIQKNKIPKGTKKFKRFQEFFSRKSVRSLNHTI